MGAKNLSRKVHNNGYRAGYRVVLNTEPYGYDLERRSGQWLVYVNSKGWERTQTLGRHLMITIIPERPHWLRWHALQCSF